MEQNVKKSYSDITAEEKALLLSRKRKYVTWSSDDGVTQDRDLMDILDRYGILCTFNINTGILGTKGEVSNGKVTVPHNKVSREEVANGYYRNHEIAVHTLTHPSLPAVSPEEVKRQIVQDEQNIKELTGVAPTGMAYPGGGYDHNDEIMEIILRESGLRYARTVVSTHGFGLPQRFMEWNPSFWWFEDCRDQITDRFAAARPEQEDLILYIWGHAYELDFFDARESIDAYCRRLSEIEDAVFVTNRVLYKLFSDRVKP